MDALAAFPARVQWCDPKTGLLTPEALRFLRVLMQHVVALEAGGVVPATGTDGHVLKLVGGVPTWVP